VPDTIIKNIISSQIIDDDQEGDTAKKQCENELYHLLLGTEFNMKMKNVESKVYNCPLSWWKTSAGQYMNLGKLSSSILLFLQHLLHLSVSGVEQQESSLSREIG
jgi:hypothetical protein